MSNLKTKAEALKVYHVIEPNGNYEYVITDYVFNRKNMCDAHDTFGQRFGCERAGCYSLDNIYTEEDFCKHNEEKLLDLLQEKFQEAGYDKCLSIKEYKDTDEDLYYEVLKKEFDRENAEEHMQARYGTFWNGHNYVSVFIDDNDTNFTGDLEEISNEEEKEILDDLKNSIQQDYSGYGELYKGKKYEFVMSYAQDAWETYTVRKLTDEE